MTPVLKSLGIFGGTFDPVHRGHLAIAQAFRQHLQLDELRLVPARVPPHRPQPQASGADRLAMLRLAAANTGLCIDDRELRRDGPSYTIDTLEALRREQGNDVSLVLCLGSDAFARLDTWHRWQELLSLAHMAVALRADDMGEFNPAVRELVARHGTVDAATLKITPCGRVYLAQLDQIPVSSTGVRAALAATRTSPDLHPDVLHTIQQRGLYLSR